ncbi:MAG: hypothetical protein JST39_04400 [Bacteroidetes bacterium]|nr:hypothetical protein [Bacteroidota bacterium]
MLFSCLKKDIDYNEGSIPGPFVILEDVRTLYKGSPVALSDKNLMGGSKITGIVISDASAGNIRKGTVVIQQTKRGFTRGIALDLGEGFAVPYVPGDSVIVDIAGTTLTTYKGTLEITGVSSPKVSVVATGKLIKPIDISLTDLAAGFGTFESVLVQVSGVDISPAPAANETYSGDKGLKDASNGTGILHTEPSASFASARLPINAAFTGIATYYNATSDSREGAARQLWMRNISDVQNASGALYFTENFENGTPLKTNYAAGTVKFASGPWMLDNAVIANTANDVIVSGQYAIRVQQNLSVSAYLQMNFDLPQGATKVSLWHASYGASADPPATWRLEYSTNGGNTWTQTGSDIRSVSKTKSLITFPVNITGPVRFRINKLGLGSNAVDPTIENGRLGIDDFSIYQQP